MQRLNGLRILVTGAAGGIGSALVGRLSSDGAVVAATDIAAPSGRGIAYAAPADITNEAEVDRLVADVIGAIGGIDALVAVAGIHVSSPTHELSLESFRKVLDVSVIGTFLTTRAVLPGMLERGSGRIVTFGSTAAVCAAPGLASYSAAKGAVLQYTRSIAVEYASRGIRANCLCPGGTLTPLLRQINAERSERDHFLEGHPIGRYAQPEEIAAAASFLLSDDSSFVLGAALMVDGGYSAI
jgi:NAD(P)-dependent dehydrogenase (short-subunit alcohol dehydrogenase family)